MIRAHRAVPVLAALLFLGAAVRAWQPETRVRMVDEAVRFMPASLRLVLETRREALLRGMLEPMVEEDDPAHRPPWHQGTLDRQVALRAAALIDSVDQAEAFDRVARNFGELAHFVADAGFPPVAGGTDGAARYGDFAAFCESRRARFPLVFYGHDDPDLERGDFEAFAMRILREARTEDANLARAYLQAGDPPAPGAFDDRSIPFAVGSLSYSRTVTHIVRAWLAAWRGAHGDLGSTPYMQHSDPDTDTDSTNGRP